MPTEGDGKKIFRLTDIVAQEVSLVDRAANKHKFLIVKSEAGDMGTKITPDGNGGFTASADADDTATVEKIQLSQGDRTRMLGKIGKAMAALTQLANRVKNASDATDSGTPATKSVEQALSAIGASLQGGSSAGAAGDKEAAKAAGEEGEEAATAPTEGEAEGETPAPDPEADTEPPAEGEAAPAEDGSAPLDKAVKADLAKMLGVAAEKLNQVRSLLSVNESLTSDEFTWKVREAVDLLRQHVMLERIIGAATTMRDDSKEPTFDATAFISELNKVLGKLDAEGPEEVTAKRAAYEAEIKTVLEKSLGGVADRVKTLAGLVKAQRAKIHKLEAQTASSRAAVVDNDGAPKPVGAEPWPFDMAAERDITQDYPLD